MTPRTLFVEAQLWLAVRAIRAAKRHIAKARSRLPANNSDVRLGLLPRALLAVELELVAVSRIDAGELTNRPVEEWELGRVAA